MWRRLSGYPGGRRLFSFLLFRRVRYSGTIGARVVELEPGRCVAVMRDRPAVRNHLQSIHATALVTFGELASGLSMAAALPPRSRAIVTGLDVEYKKKARGPLTVLGLAPIPGGAERKEYVVTASITDAAGRRGLRPARPLARRTGEVRNESVNLRSVPGTRFTEQVGIEVPLICGAMYPCSNPELVAAVSAAGGIGIVQPISMVYVHGHELRDGLRLIRSVTDKPIGFNAIVEKSVKAYEQRMRRWVDVAIEEGVRFFITALGNPRWVVDAVHSVGGIVYHDVTERRWADRALQEGVDGLICVNDRAGGHAGSDRHASSTSN